MNDEQRQHSPQRTGVLVFIALAVLTVLEFVIAFMELQWWSVFIIIAVIKAWLVIQYYMHFSRLFAEETVRHDN